MKIYLAGRGGGKTYQLVKLVRQTSGAVLVVRDYNEKDWVLGTYDIRSEKVVTVNEVLALRGLLPIPKLAVDNFDFNYETLRKLRGFEIIAVSINGENEMRGWL